MATKIILHLVTEGSANEGIPVYWMPTDDRFEAGRLASGAVVRELHLSDKGFLSMSKVSGNGPDFGWIDMNSAKPPLLTSVDKVWTVVEGEDKGGILVREGFNLKSSECSQRLSTGALVRELAFRSDRLHYERITGSGPKTGWVSSKVAGKELLKRKHLDLESQLPKVLPRLTRTPRLPGREVLPENLQKFVKPDRSDRSPQLYFLLIPGASDTYLPHWCNRQLMVRPDIELGTYEWPGHGSRTDAMVETFEELGDDCFEAFPEAMTAGSFVLMSHSLGTRIMIYVAERAQRELGVKPLAAYALDYGPPHLSALSDYGMDIMRNRENRDEFMRIMETPMFVKHQEYKLEKAKAERYTGPGSDEDMDTYFKDRLFHLVELPVGYHYFACPLYVYLANRFWSPNKLESFEKSLQSPVAGSFQWVNWREERNKYTRSGAGIEFTKEEFKTWGDWGYDVHFEYVDADHMDIFENQELIKNQNDLITKFVTTRRL